MTNAPFVTGDAPFVPLRSVRFAFRVTGLPGGLWLEPGGLHHLLARAVRPSHRPRADRGTVRKSEDFGGLRRTSSSKVFFFLFVFSPKCNLDRALTIQGTLGSWVQCPMICLLVCLLVQEPQLVSQCACLCLNWSPHRQKAGPQTTHCQIHAEDRPTEWLAGRVDHVRCSAHPLLPVEFAGIGATKKLKRLVDVPSVGSATARSESLFFPESIAKGSSGKSFEH